MLPPPGRPPNRQQPPVPQPPSAAALQKRDQRMTRRPPQGKMTQAQRSVSPAEEAAFATIEAEIGGRQRLVGVLSTAQLPKDVEQVLGMIADPLHDHESLAKICALGNVGLPKLMKMFEGALRTRGQLLAHTRIAASMPDLAAAVMEDSIPGWRECRTCMGSQMVEVEVKSPEGTHTESRPCTACKGNGLVWFQPDHEVQKTALKISGLLESGKGAGVNVAVLQNNTQNNPGDTGNYDQLMGMLDGVLYGTGRERLGRRSTGAPASAADPIDGEIADAE